MSLVTLRRTCGLLALAATAVTRPAVAAPLSIGAARAVSAVRPSPPKAKRAKARPASRSVARRRTSERRVAARPAADSAPIPAFPTLVAQSIATLHVAGSDVPLEIVGVAPASVAPASVGNANVALASATPSGTITARPFAAFSASAERMLSGMMDRARSQLGTRYVLGGNRPDEALDCSSFARFAMQALGITLPRTAAQQAKVGDAVPRDRKQLRPGDLLTFGSRKRVSHVGIYLGEGRFIHASVKSGQVIETTIERNARLFRRWLGARRMLAASDSSPARGDG